MHLVGFITKKFIIIPFFIGIWTLQFNMASFKTVVHRDLSSAYFPYLLAPIDSRSFSIQPQHLKFDFHYFILPSGFPRNTFFTLPSSDILITWPARYSLLTFTIVKTFGFLHKTCNSSSVRILQLFWPFVGPHILVFSAPMFVYSLQWSNQRNWARPNDVTILRWIVSGGNFEDYGTDGRVIMKLSLKGCEGLESSHVTFWGILWAR